MNPRPGWLRWPASLLFLVSATYLARDLVNDPLSYLTAKQLAKEAQEKAEAEEQARLAAESEKANQASSEEAKGE